MSLQLDCDIFFNDTKLKHAKHEGVELLLLEQRQPPAIGFQFYSTCLHVQINNSNTNLDVTEADLFLSNIRVPVQKK